GDRLFLQCDNETKSFLVAFDKKTGNELWRVSRNAKSSWSTPFVWHNAKRTELVVCGGNKVSAHDPATGKLLWELGGLEGQFSATPVADDNMLYVGVGAAGFSGSRPLFAVRAGASGDITLKDGQSSSEGVAWRRNGAGPSMASPLLYGGLLYILEQYGGIL